MTLLPNAAPRPALTPDEWKDGFYDSEDILVQRRRPALDGSPRLDVIVRAHPIGSGVMGNPGDLHALAALCLHGQPFGFSREDAKALRQYVAIYGFYHPFLGRIADRIEALLPPEGA